MAIRSIWSQFLKLAQLRQTARRSTPSRKRLLVEVLESRLALAILLGTPGDDVITMGNGGDDTIEGYEGNDTLQGGPGSDTVRGGPGNDIVGGGQGIDFVFGGSGNDTVNGGLGNDFLYADAPNETLPGNDIVDGGDGNDEIYTRGATDASVSPSRTDTLTGGAGQDRFVFDAPDSLTTSTPYLGTVRITDFEFGTDKLDIREFVTGFGAARFYDSFSQVLDQSSQVGADIHIALVVGANLPFPASPNVTLVSEIVLVNRSIASMTPAMFYDWRHGE